MKRSTRPHSRLHRTTAAERAQWVERFRHSGLTQREFAAQRGLGFSTLGRWLGQTPRPPVQAVPPRWQEVPLQAVLGGAPAWAAELVLQDGTTLRLAPAVASSLLQRWLGRRPC